MATGLGEAAVGGGREREPFPGTGLVWVGSRTRGGCGWALAAVKAAWTTLTAPAQPTAPTDPTASDRAAATAESVG